MIYKYAKQQMSNFMAFSLVSQSKKTSQSFFIEEAWMKDIKHALFGTVEEAQLWMKNTLDIV